MAEVAITTLGYLTFPHESGLSCNVLEAFRLTVIVMLLPSSTTLCMSLVGVGLTELTWVI
jgi:hypothetical protein